MCLAVPGKIIQILDDNPITRLGKVDFSGVVKEINLAYVPDASINDYVIVHVGFAISKLLKKEAEETLKHFDQIDKLRQGDKL